MAQCDVFINPREEGDGGGARTPRAAFPLEGNPFWRTKLPANLTGWESGMRTALVVQGGSARPGCLVLCFPQQPLSCVPPFSRMNKDGKSEAEDIALF